MAGRADMADRAVWADRADRAYRADRADRAGKSEIMNDPLAHSLAHSLTAPTARRCYRI